MPKPKHRLEELEVNEVSIVDRGANQKRFLIVKNEKGNLQIKESDGMPKTKTKKSETDTSLASLLFGEDWGDESTVSVDGGKEEVLKAIKKILGRLVTVANACKVEKSEDADNLVSTTKSALVKLFKHIAGDRDLQIEIHKNKKFVDLVMEAVEVLTETVNAINELPEGFDEVPADVVNGLEKVISAVSSALSVATEEEPEDEPEDEPEEVEANDSISATLGFEIFKDLETTSGEAVVCLKRGSAMKKVRLSVFKDAVSKLVKLIEELEGTKQETNKSEVNKDLTEKLDQVLKLKDTLGDSLGDQLNPLIDRLTSLEKRQEEFETANPGSNGADEEETVSEPVAKSMWGDSPFSIG